MSAWTAGAQQLSPPGVSQLGRAALQPSDQPWTGAAPVYRYAACVSDSAGESSGRLKRGAFEWCCGDSRRPLLSEWERPHRRAAQQQQQQRERDGEAAAAAACSLSLAIRAAAASRPQQTAATTAAAASGSPMLQLMLLLLSPRPSLSPPCSCTSVFSLTAHCALLSLPFLHPASHLPAAASTQSAGQLVFVLLLLSSASASRHVAVSLPARAAIRASSPWRSGCAASGCRCLLRPSVRLASSLCLSAAARL